MMQEIITDFIDFMSQRGLEPARHSDIKATNKRQNYQLSSATNHKKHGFYKLEIEGDFGYGYCGDYRDDSCFTWYSKSSNKYSKSEMEEIKRKAELQRIENDKEKQEQHDQKATYAQDFTVFLDDCPDDHPYLLKKNIKPCGALLSGNDIIIPMSDTQKMWSYQSIDMEGNKQYLTGGRKTGSYFVIKGDETICIVEGFATGATIHEATGHTVIVTFDSANLKTVSKIIRQDNPSARIVICADNDYQGKDTRGNPRNAGLISGAIAAKNIDADMAYPDFQEEHDKYDYSDFNDYAKIHNLEKVKILIHDAKRDGQGSGGVKESSLDLQAPAARTNQEPEIDWSEFLQYDNKGNVDIRSALNARLYVENATLLKGLFRYNSFSKLVMVCKCPPWENESTFKVRPLKDTDYFNLLCHLEYEYKIKVGKNVVADCLESTAHNEENIFNPATDYFNSLEWDGISRLDDWLRKYVSDGSQNDDYLTLVGRKFLCGMAARAMHPAIKFDTMIILEGDQYAGKSRLARMLATINGEEYFLDDFRDIDNKDTLMKMQGKLIVEFPELSTMRKAEVDDLKAFVTRQSDVFRMPYGRQVIDAPRQCVFIGTVNPEGGYLRDVTGNRRYWPIACRERLLLDDMIKAIPQLHAEAAHLVKEGEQLWITEKEYALAVIEQNKRVVDDVWADRIYDIVNGRHTVSSDDIMEGLNISVDKRNPLMYKRIKDTMLKEGYKYGLYQIGNKRKRGYHKVNKQVLV